MAKGKNAVAIVEEATAPKGPSLVIQLGLLGAMTVAALGVGWFSGGYLKRSEAPPGVTASGEKQEHKPATAKEGAPVSPSAGPLLVQLAPITTNLASPDTVWVRLDASIVLDAPQPPAMAEAVHQDLLALVRTLKMHQVEGPSGFLHLKDDLRERAAIRSEGHVTDVLIRTLVFE